MSWAPCEVRGGVGRGGALCSPEPPPHALQGLKNQMQVKLNIVSCPPVTTVLIKRPDLKYQLGFSVQNGIVSPSAPSSCRARAQQAGGSGTWALVAGDFAGFQAEVWLWFLPPTHPVPVGLFVASSCCGGEGYGRCSLHAHTQASQQTHCAECRGHALVRSSARSFTSLAIQQDFGLFSKY